MEKISLKTNKRIELVDITGKVQSVVTKSKVKDGVCFIFAPHTTAGLTINENADPSVQADLINTLDRLVPEAAGIPTPRGIRRSCEILLVRQSLTIFVEGGRLSLGPGRVYIFAKGMAPGQERSGLK